MTLFRRTATTTLSLLFAALLASAATLGAAGAETVVQNDGFMSGDTAGFQAGFVAGEMGASRLVLPAGRQLLAVRLLFGGAATTKTVTLHVWDDTAGTTAPGAELFSGDFDVTGADNALHDLNVAGDNVFVPAQFRIGIEFQHNGLPSIARDADGTVAADKNFIYANLGAGLVWVKSQSLGLTGDWILRAVVSDGGGAPDAGVTPDASVGPDAGNGGSCTGNGDCTIGEYCDPDTHACTFDCRHDTDCPDNGQCNSLGQCIGASSDGGGGCCSTGSGRDDGVLGALGLAGVVGLLVTRRRRESRPR